MSSIPVLERLAIFRGLTVGQLEEIADLVHERNYEAGAVICDAAEESKDLCVIADGRVALEAHAPSWPHGPSAQVTVDVLSTGDTFGAWTPSTGRGVSLRCLERSTIVALDGSALQRLARDDPHVGYTVMENLTGSLGMKLGEARKELARFREGEELSRQYTPEDTTLIQRSHDFIRLRWIAAVGVALLAVLANRAFGISFPLTPVFLTVGVILLYNLGFWLWARRLGNEPLHVVVPRIRSLVRAQSAVDLVTLVSLLHFTGGVENPFVFYLVFHIVIASVLLSQRVAYLFASLAVALFSALVVLEFLGFVPHVHLEGLVSPQLYRETPPVLAVLFSLATVLYISTYMASSIAGELRERQREVAALRDRCLIDNRALEEANRRLVEVDRLRTHFLAIASHDLRAPLAAVQSYLRVVLGGFVGDLAEEQRDILQKTSLRIDGLLKLINDLLDNARIEAGQIVSEMEDVSLSDVIDDALENVRGSAEEKGLMLDAHVPQNLPRVKGAPRRLVQVVTNLLGNAVQFTPPGGRVSVRVIVTGDHLRTEVMDTGIGISAETMPRIFEEFYRGKGVKSKGTGLGLAIAKKIVEAHGGSIWAESPYPESPKGSKFIFTLPV